MARRLVAGARALASVIVLLASTAAPPARAALAVRLSVEGLARGSDAVVRGNVARREPFRAGGRIWTEVEVRTAEVWRGAAPKVVKLVVPGGAMGDVAMRVDGSPAFEPGEEVVVFLRTSESRAYAVNGLAQGKFRIEGALASNDLRGTAFAKSDVDVAAGERAAEPMTVAELERRVREAR